MIRFWRELLIIGLVIGLLVYRGEVIGKRAALKVAAAELRQASDAIKASEGARKIEADKARAANAVAEKYEQDKKDAEAAAKRVADDLRAGNLRLRKLWEGCQARPAAQSDSASQSDAAADDRAESAGRIVRAAREADAQIRALQDFIREALQ